MAEDNFAMGYALGQDSNGGNNGMFGNDGWWGIILLALLFGYGGGGMGFGGGYGGGMMLNGIATRADINEGFALNNITGGITAIQQGICDSTYALTNAINGGFNNAQLATLQGFNGLERQLADCCCENRAAIAQVRYDMATQACDTRRAISDAARDITDNANANTRAIMDFMVNSKIESLRDENQSLKLAASQANQNNYLAALSEAQTAELIRRIAPTPVPSYAVPAPYPYCGNVNYGGCGCGC